jgi:hypothetical protein
MGGADRIVPPTLTRPSSLRLKVLVPTYDLGAVISRLVPHF